MGSLDLRRSNAHRSHEREGTRLKRAVCASERQGEEVSFMAGWSMLATMASVVLLAAFAAGAADSSVQVTAAPQEPSSARSTNALVKELGRGRWQVGAVILDKNQRSVSVPTVVNMNSALVEYLL